MLSDEETLIIQIQTDLSLLVDGLVGNEKPDVDSIISELKRINEKAGKLWKMINTAMIDAERDFGVEGKEDEEN
jgi:hypothetical protein